MTRPLLQSLVALMSLLIPAGAMAQDDRSVSVPPAESANRRPCSEVFNDQLAGLAPSRPDDYFDLAEAVADAAQDSADRRLAVTLFVLAFELDRAQTQGGRLAAQCCVGLSEVTRNTRQRGWLFGMAQVLDPRFSPPEWLAVPPPTSADSEAYQVATLLGLIRSGDGPRARQLLAKPEVKAAFVRYDVLLARMGIGSASGLIREAERWACPDCANQRVVKSRPRGDGVEVRLCFQCGGNPGPKLSRAEVLSQLRFESWLLRGINRSWAAQVSTDDGAPLLDPDPESVAVVFEVDALAVYWRNGAWCRSQDGKTPAQPPMPRLQNRRPPAAKPNPEVEVGGEGAAPAGGS